LTNDRLEITGSSTTILDGVLANSGYGSAEFSIAYSGAIAYVRGTVIPSQSGVMWVDRQGSSQSLLGVGRRFTLLSLSPDARRLALTTTGVNEQVWLYDFAHGTLRQLTFGWDNYIFGWTPDGERIVIASDRNGPYNLFWQRAESADAAERLTESPNQQQGGVSWSPDGKILLFTESRATTRWDIWSLTLAPERTLRPLIQTPFDDYFPSISPDGHWLAYVSNESGRNEVYVQPFPTLDRKWKISTDGGIMPVWARNGRELFYVNGHTLMAVPIVRAATFDSGTPRALFQRPYEFFYDVAPDGRFIMTEPEQADVVPTQITLVQNWFEELKRRMPAR
jgi:eukaryotic-like serine/threonine-protein kinase